MSTGKLSFYCGILGATAGLLFFGVFISLHALRPDLDAVTNYVSEYANGSYGWVFRSVLIVHGFGNMATAVGLAVVLATAQITISRSAWCGPALFAGAALGIVLGGIFSIDPAGAPSTVAGAIHTRVSSIAFPIEAGGLLLLRQGFRQLPEWRSLAFITSIAASGGVAALVWLLAAVITGSMPGLAERVVFLLFMTWEILTANFLMLKGRQIDRSLNLYR